MVNTIAKEERSTSDTKVCHQIDLPTKSDAQRGPHTNLGRINDPLDFGE